MVQERLSPAVAETVARAAWALRRSAAAFTRRFGWLGVLLLISLAINVSAWWLTHHQRQTLVQTQLGLTAEQLATRQPIDAREMDGRARLKAFDDNLLPHAEIALVLRDLFELAADESLSIRRGEYRPQIDVLGKFMRYRMNLPVQGDAQAIHRFMRAALDAHRTLALESAQFKRDRIESSNIEARIQWVLLTRLPAQSAARTAAAGPR